MGKHKNITLGLWSKKKLLFLFFPNKNNYFYLDQNKILQLWIMVGKIRFMLKI